tara:strand:- start:4 stop:588 length:585 start_codon:yes stop_codon:yes gene_type:complete
MLGMIGGGIQALGGLAQAASGIFGKKKRQRRLENLLAERPKYKIPTEISQDLELTRNMKDGRLSEQQDMQNALFTNAQNSVARAQSSSGSLEDQLAIGMSADAGMQDALIKNRMSGAQERASRLANMREAGTNMAGAKDQAFKLNELDPFKAKLQGTLANDAMSRQMTFGGLNQAGAGLANMGSSATAAGIKTA